MQKVSVIIVDDEPLARQGLALRLEQQKDFSLVAQCGDGEEALVAIKKHKPDVVFLDIEMPRMNGIQLAQLLFDEVLHKEPSHQESKHMPKIVFVTAFKEFALDAFEFEAFDYLLKPICDERVSRCLSKLKSELVEQDTLVLHEQLDNLLIEKTGSSVEGFMRRLSASPYFGVDDLSHVITLKSGSEYIRIESKHLLWIEAAGDYMCVHTQEGTQIIRKTLSQFEQELNANLFIRISRSAIINLSKLVRLNSNSNGEYIATLCSGDDVKVTRNYRDALLERVKSSEK